MRSLYLLYWSTVNSLLCLPSHQHYALLVPAYCSCCLHHVMLWALLLYFSVSDKNAHRSTYRIQALGLLMVADYHPVVHNSVILMDRLIHVTLVEVADLLHLLDFRSMEEVVPSNHSYDMIRSHHDHDLYHRLFHLCLFRLLLLFQLGC